jgi:hypothetical protein
MTITNNRLRELLKKAEDRALEAGESFEIAEHADTATALRELLDLRARLESLIAAAPAEPEGEPVAWCALTPSGKIAYFDGKPMVMVGPLGNEHHATPLVPRSTRVQQPTPPPRAVDDAMVFRLACWLAAYEGHDDPHTLIWEGNPPEPWGEVWNRYQDLARRGLEAALAAKEGG